METINFWDKKAKLSYLLAIFVFMRHISTFDNYVQGSDFCSSLVYYIDRIFASITPIAVPLFFMLSGALFFRGYNNSMYFDKLKRRFHSLMIPYLAWNTIYLLFSVLATLYLTQFFIGRQPFDFTFGNVIKGIFLYGQNGHFWFIFDLIVFVTCAPIVYYLIRNWRMGGGISRSYCNIGAMWFGFAQDILS